MSASAAPGSDVWPTNARHWHLLASPLRPSAEDAIVVTRVASELARTLGRPLRALLLGVTPEIATIDWPAETSLVAIDKCEGMIRAVWPSWGVPKDATVRCADWRAMPIEDASVDLVSGDGAYNALVHRDYATVTSEVRRVLRPGGALVMRTFVSPPAAQRETVRHVAEELWAGRIGSFHSFKWRLAMALQTSFAAGVRVHDVWRVWSDMCPDPEALAAKLGWDAATIASIDGYRNAATTYTFPTLQELRAELAPAFGETSCHVPSYELGDRCPTHTFFAR